MCNIISLVLTVFTTIFGMNGTINTATATDSTPPLFQSIETDFDHYIQLTTKRDVLPKEENGFGKELIPLSTECELQKTKIVASLNSHILKKSLSDDETKRAIEIATVVDASNLKARLEIHRQPDKGMACFNILHLECLHLIIDQLLSNSEDIDSIMNILNVSKGFNLALLSYSLRLNSSNLRTYYGFEVIGDRFLAKIATLFPAMVDLNLFQGFKISKHGLKHLRNLENLTALNIQYCNQVGDEGVASISALPNLQRLRLGGIYNVHKGSPLTDKGLQPLTALKHITHLNFAKTQATDQGLGLLLTHLTNLQYLTVEASENVTDTLFQYLKLSIKLAELRLIDCHQITGAGLKHLTNLQAVTSLTLRGNAVSDEVVEHIKVFKKLSSVILFNINSEALKEYEFTPVEASE